MTSWGGEVPWSEDASTILDSMKAPSSASHCLRSARVRSLHGQQPSQTGLNEFQRLMLDLKEPEPQTVTQTFQDETGLGTRTTTWAFALTPSFNIEREDRATDGRHSFVSTDSIRLHMAIPGMTIAKSGWANLPSWEVKPLGPFSGSGVPNSLPHSPSFSFEPNPRSPSYQRVDRSQPAYPVHCLSSV